MPWIPESDPMVTVTESQVFSVTIQYFELIGGMVDPVSGIETPGTPVYYNVTVTPQIEDPSTITITGNGTTEVTISGYYGPVFNDQIKSMLTYDVVDPTNTAEPTYREYTGTGTWANFASYDDNFEVVSFIPDQTRTRDLYYTCVSNGNTIDKFNRVQDLNWESGMQLLKQAVDSTNRRVS